MRENQAVSDPGQTKNYDAFLLFLQILDTNVDNSLILVKFLFLFRSFGILIVLVAAGQHDEIFSIRRGMKYGVQAAIAVGIAVMYP